MNVFLHTGTREFQCSSGAIGQRAVLIRRETFHLQWSPKPNIKDQMGVISLPKDHSVW